MRTKMWLAAKAAETAEAVKETEAAQTSEDVLLKLISANPVLLAALAVALIVLVVVILRMRNKKTTGGTTEHTRPTQVGEINFTMSCLQGLGTRLDQQDCYATSDPQDAELYHRKGFLALVADGMGGLSNGSLASSTLITSCHNSFYSQKEDISTSDMLLEVAKDANAAVNQVLQGNGRSGSTLLAAVIRDGRLYYLTVGDSRIYLYRGGALIWLNREHVYREELSVKAVNGKNSVDWSNQDPQAKALTSYFGIGYIPYLDRNTEGIKLLSKDKIILCSDGIFGTLTETQMEQVLALPVTDASRRMDEMIQAAGKPHQDNYTALILEYQG